VRRAIENVEVAAGMLMLFRGKYSESIAAGIDEFSIGQSLGGCAMLAPFNCPGMIPFWFLPYALACSNTVVSPHAERIPLIMERVLAVLAECGVPAGVANLVSGGRACAERLASPPTARAVYGLAFGHQQYHRYERCINVSSVRTSYCIGLSVGLGLFTVTRAAVRLSKNGS